MDGPIPKDLRFNLGFLLEAPRGTRRDIELAYPKIRLADDLVLSPLEGVLNISRNSNGLYLTGHLVSQALVDCSRCLASVPVAIEMEIGDLFYYPPAAAPMGEYIIGDDGHLDLAPLIRELSLLEIPIQVWCRPDCAGLCAECGQNLNHQECDCVTDDIDPRMAALRKLLDE